MEEPPLIVPLEGETAGEWPCFPSLNDREVDSDFSLCNPLNELTLSALEPVRGVGHLDKPNGVSKSEKSVKHLKRTLLEGSTRREGIMARVLLSSSL